MEALEGQSLLIARGEEDGRGELGLL
jgi:hypothetical protein